jgi:hypothetical protein
MPLTEGDKLEEWAINLINDYQASGNYGKSQPKRIARFSGEIVANPEAYYELFEMARSQNMTAEQLLSSVRSIENQLLDEASRGTKTSRKQLLSDVIHHFYAQRTGGDTLRRLGQADRKQTRIILRDEFGRWGNVDDNLPALFRAFHGNWEKAKGREAEAIAALGYDPNEAGKLGLPLAHQTSASSGKISGTAKGDTVQDALDTMRPQFELQRIEGNAALEAQAPIRDQLTELAGGSGPTTAQTAEELARQRRLLEANPGTSTILQRNIKTLLKNSKGVARFVPGVADNLALAGVVGLGVGGSTLLSGGGVQAAGKNALTAAKDIATADIQDVKTSITTERTNNLSTLQRDFQGLAGLSGLASMIPGLNIGGGVAAATFSAAGMLVGNRIQRDEARERRQESLANPRYVNPFNEHVLTKTDTSFKSGRY